MSLEDKYIGLALALCSSLAIGTSFVITKKGLIHAGEKLGFEGDGFIYLKSPLWWAGIVTLVLGEICNFAAYAFAPAILVTPLGALSVLIGAVLGSFTLKEELGTLGKIGSAICLIGSVIIVLHAPPDREITTIDQFLALAVKPAFLIYCFAVAAFTIIMIHRVAPIHGRTNVLIYLAICSAVGSVSVMCVKAFGLAIKLTFAGNNQFKLPSTYLFIALTAVGIFTQMTYFNKALAQFPSNIVNPVYYVTFTTATLCASFILFRGFNTVDAVSTLSLLCGFLVTFSGVYLVNLSRTYPCSRIMTRLGSEAMGTDLVSSFQTRLSMQARRSADLHRHSTGSQGGDREGLIRAYDEEEGAGFGLSDLTGDSDDETSMDRTESPTKRPVGEGIELEPRKL